MTRSLRSRSIPAESNSSGFSSGTGRGVVVGRLMCWKFPWARVTLRVIRFEEAMLFLKPLAVGSKMITQTVVDQCKTPNKYTIKGVNIRVRGVYKNL